MPGQARAQVGPPYGWTGRLASASDLADDPAFVAVVDNLMPLLPTLDLSRLLQQRRLVIRCLAQRIGRRDRSTAGLHESVIRQGKHHDPLPPPFPAARLALATVVVDVHMGLSS